MLYYSNMGNFNANTLIGNEITGGSYKGVSPEHKGVQIILTPFLLSMVLLGIKVASDPKLDFVYKKHKMSGCNMTKSLQQIINTMNQNDIKKTKKKEIIKSKSKSPKKSS